MTGHYYYGSSRLIAEPVAKNPGEDQRCKHKDAADFKTQASGSASRKTLGSPHSPTHRRKQEEGVAAKPGLWQHPACCCLWWTEKVAPIRLLSPS